MEQKRNNVPKKRKNVRHVKLKPKKRPKLKKRPGQRPKHRQRQRPRHIRRPWSIKRVLFKWSRSVESSWREKRESARHLQNSVDGKRRNDYGLRG